MLNNNHSLTHFPPPILPTPYTYNNITMEAIIKVFIHWLYRMKVLWSRWMFNFSLLKHKTNIKQHALHITVKPV